MSIFQQGLDMFKNASKNFKEIEDEPILEDIEPSPDIDVPKKKIGLDDIKAQAREKAAKEMEETNNVQNLLINFKKFLSRDKRTKMMALCEREDSGKLGYITMMAFSRVLKNMGFRLLFDQVKNLITVLNVYNPNKDRVLYNKIISSAFRKLYKRDPYQPPPKFSQMQAIALIQNFIKHKREQKNLKIKISKESVKPKDIINGLAQKIQQNPQKSLIKTFEEIDNNHNGFIELHELDTLFKTYGVELTQDHLRLVFSSIDTGNKGKITFRDLLSVVESYQPTSTNILDAIAMSPAEKELLISEVISSLKILFKDAKMTPETMYKVFDKKNTGNIDFSSFKNIILKLTDKYTTYQIQLVFQYIDTGKDGYLSYREFGRVFFDVNESPAEILKRKEIEERKKIEDEIKRKWEEEKNKNKFEPHVEPKVEHKATIQEEIRKKQMEIEEAQRKEALKKIDPYKVMVEEAKIKEKEAQEKKKKEFDEKIKKDQENKLRIAKALDAATKPKPEAKKNAKRPGSVGPRKSGTEKKKEPIKKTLEDKVSRLIKQPIENDLVSKMYSRELMDMMKKEFILPLISQAIVHGDSILLARQGQVRYENRPVTKYVYKWHKEWSQEVLNPMPRTLWASGTIGRLGYIDDQSYLKQFDILAGTSFPVLHLGTKPPLQQTSLLSAVCDSNTGRLYLLNKHWIIEVWELHQATTTPLKRIKVLSKIIKQDHIEQVYKNKYKDMYPKLLTLSNKGKILVNATCVDGFLYCYEPVSLTILWKLRLTIKELQIPEAVMKAFDEFCYFIRECTKLGISESRLFELLDTNGDGILSYNEFCNAIKENNLPLTENQIKSMYKTMDTDQSGNLSIDEFWGGVYMRKQETLVRENAEKSLIQVPEWLNNVNAAERAREALYKFHRAIDSKGLTHEQLFKSIDTDNSKSISRSEFHTGIQKLLFPLINSSEIEILIEIADKDNSGLISFKEFNNFLSLKKISTEVYGKIDSQSFSKDSLDYVIHKCLELGIDLYNICKGYDKTNTGTIAKENLSSILLWLPIGITAKELKIITEKDLVYSPTGKVDYQEIFEKEEYLKLIKSAKKPGIELVEPPIKEETGIIEDYELLDELSLVAFSTTTPVSSIVYLKHLNGKLIAKLMGHFSEQAPVLHYIPSSNVLLTGEKRELKYENIYPALPPCELFVWNLQKDLIDKFQHNPPWTVKPYKRVYAHEGSIIDICYLPITQLVVTTGADGLIKLWTPTGTPYSLTETHNLPIATKTPGVYIPLKPQLTSSNQLLTCVGVISNKNTICYRVFSNTFENAEWLICLQVASSTTKNFAADLQSWAFKRLQISVPAKQHDWEIPSQISADLFDLFVTHRNKTLAEYRAGLALRLEKIVANTKIAKTFEKEIKIATIRSILFECNYENVLKIIVVLPDRLEKGKVSIEEFYNAMVAYAGFSYLHYSDFFMILEDFSEKAPVEPVEKKSGLGLVTLVKMIEDKKAPSIKPEPLKPPVSLISSIQTQTKKRESLFETPNKNLEQELFEYLSARLMKTRISVSQLFEVIDKDQNGLISPEEFSEFLSQIGFSLKKSEVKSIMRCIDNNNDEVISFKELMAKLTAYGYSEEWKPTTYSHEWEDASLKNFFKNFINKNQFRTIFEFLSYHDYNKDGSLSILELRNALASIDRTYAERLMNIVLITSMNNMSIPDLTKAITQIENELPRPKKKNITYKAMELCLERCNAIEQLRKTVEDLGLYCLALTTNSKRGLELLARQYRLVEGLQLLTSGIIRFQELIDYLFSISLTRVLNESKKILINPEQNVLLNTVVLDTTGPDKLDPSDFKVGWENEEIISEAIRQYNGNLLPSLDNVFVVVYSPEGLKHVSRDGTAFYSHVVKELAVHAALQARSDDIVSLVGYHEKYLGLDKTIFSVYREVPGMSLQQLIANNGGLLKIPVLYNTKVSLYLLKYWGKKILRLLSLLQGFSIALRCLSPENLKLSPDGNEITLTSLKGLGIFDTNGTILSAPDISLYTQQDIKKNVYIAPEFYFNSKQTSAVDVWSFGCIMYSLLFGHSPRSFVEQYTSWCDNKFVNTDVVEEPVIPSVSFPYDIYDGYEIRNGRACPGCSTGLGIIKSLKFGSFAGIVRDTPVKNELDEIEEIYKNLKDVKNTKTTLNTDMGKAIDLISLCLQVEPHKRPTIKGLLTSSFFNLDKYEEKQAKSFAELIFEHRNPEIIITQDITVPLTSIKNNPALSTPDSVINIIEKLGFALLNFEDTITDHTFQAISSMNLSSKEKDEILKKKLNSPITELANQAIKDDIFSMLCYLSLNFFHSGDSSVLMVFCNLLKYLLFHLNSEDSGLSSLVSELIETLIKLFVGEDTCLGSKKYSEGYTLKESYWSPDLNEIISPLYRQSISESGYGQYNCPVIKQFLTKNRHPDYFSELLMLSENFSLLKKPNTTTVSKRNALRHIKSMLITQNYYKTLAAFDFKLPQLIINCIQDADYKVRSEAVFIFLLITDGCVEPLLPKLPGVSKDYKALGLAKFFTVDKKTPEAPLERTDLKESIKGLAVCFESPMFIFPIVRLLKIKSEPYETKENAIKILITVLQGNEKCQLSCLSPITDTISTLCKCLVVSTKTTDIKTGKTLPPLVKELLAKLLTSSRSHLLASFKNTPGAEALLKEQNLYIPEKITLQTLKAITPLSCAIDNNIKGLVQGLKNWLVHERETTAKNIKEEEIVLNCLDFLRDSVDYYWNLAADPEAPSPTLQKSVKEKINIILMMLEWTLFSEFDFGWFKKDDNVIWAINITSKAIESSGSHYQVFELEEESMVCQRILCRLLSKDKANITLGKFKFGLEFSRQLSLQYIRLIHIIINHTEPLHLLQYYPPSRQIRLATFFNLLQYPNLQMQFLDTNFMEMLVKDFLTDYKVLSAKFNKLNLEFLPFRDTPPVRCEAINIIMIIIKEKKKCKLVYDDLLLHIQRYKTIQNEVLNVQTSNPVIQSTAFELLQAFISSGEQQLEYLMMQSNAKSVFNSIIQTDSQIGTKFPVIYDYTIKL